MNTSLSSLFESLARLAEYPTAALSAQLAECQELLRDTDATTAVVDNLAVFAAGIEAMPLAVMEELYIQTFDFNPKTTLDLGWQLFAEDYNRGLFLAKLRAESRRLGVTESQELPDHLPHVLRLVARMEGPEAEDFLLTCVLPALGKTRLALEVANPYTHLIQCVIALLETLAGRPVEIGSSIALPVIDDLQDDSPVEVTLPWQQPNHS